MRFCLFPPSFLSAPAVFVSQTHAHSLSQLRGTASRLVIFMFEIGAAEQKVADCTQMVAQVRRSFLFVALVCFLSPAPARLLCLTGLFRRVFVFWWLPLSVTSILHCVSMPVCGYRRPWRPWLGPPKTFDCTNHRTTYLARSPSLCLSLLSLLSHLSPSNTQCRRLGTKRQRRKLRKPLRT